MRKKTKSSSDRLRHMLGTTEQRPVKIDRVRSIVAPSYAIVNGRPYKAEPGEEYKPMDLPDGDYLRPWRRELLEKSRQQREPRTPSWKSRTKFTKRSKGALASKQRP